MKRIIAWLKADDISNEMGGAYFISTLRITLVIFLTIGSIVLIYKLI